MANHEPRVLLRGVGVVVLPAAEHALERACHALCDLARARRCRLAVDNTSWYRSILTEAQRACTHSNTIYHGNIKEFLKVLLPRYGYIYSTLFFWYNTFFVIILRVLSSRSTTI